MGEYTTANVGIIGQGFVGSAVREKFRRHYNIIAYDKKWNGVKEYDAASGLESNLKGKGFGHIVKKTNGFIFVCVPTPMYEDGQCDTSIVESVISDIATSCRIYDKKVIAIVKSTVPPGTSEKLNSISDRVNVVFNPEFLTEANAVSDYENQTRIILGVENTEVGNATRDLFRPVFPDAEIRLMGRSDSEMVKYMTNLFLATKVSFFNDMYRFCQEIGANYEHIIDATLLDPRIGKSHYMVPGPDGDFGYGGHCFPKDVSAILYEAQQKGLSMPTLLGAHTTNRIVRTDKDWEKMEGRAVSTKKVDADGIQ